jgi:threonine/homoserine/homoserine lactone efflux protein
LLAALGVETGSLVHVLAALVGLSALLATTAAAFVTLKILGAIYLIGLGVQHFLDRGPGAPTQQASRARPRRIYLQGLLVNVLNPKTVLFFVALLPQFVDPHRTVWSQVLVLGLTFTVLGLLTDSLFALGASSIGRWLGHRPGLVSSTRYAVGASYVGLGLTTLIVGHAGGRGSRR